MTSAYYDPYDPMCDTEVAEHRHFHNQKRDNNKMTTTEMNRIKAPFSPLNLDPYGKRQDESTPDGLDQHESGAKLDNGKPRVSLVLGGFAEALMEVAKVGTFGANKYTDNGWKEVKDGQNRYTDAMLRHYLYEMTGEDIDPDSDLYHAAHLAWNALARLQFIIDGDPNHGNEKN